MAAKTRISLYDLDFPALEALLASWRESRADGRRSPARQVWEWLYHGGATGFDQMTTLPRTLRERLAAETTLTPPAVVARQEDPEGETRKDLLQLEDGEGVEVVLLRYRARLSACVSTQVGCACGCPFCATGQMGFVRQLTSGEILAQVLHMQRELAAVGERLSNVVLMGMGEPFMNYEQALTAVRNMVDPRGLDFPQRRITLSTVGIVPGIKRLAEAGPRIKLAISLHAATDRVRSQLVPVNERYPLDDLFAAVKLFTARAQHRVMLEWVLIEGINDTLDQARALVERTAELPVHVNLIRLNPTADYGGRSPSPEAIEAFAAVLRSAGVPHTMRQRRGGAIAAGCGQLRSRDLHRPNHRAAA